MQTRNDNPVTLSSDACLSTHRRPRLLSERFGSLGNGCFTAWRGRRFAGLAPVGNSFVCCDMRCCTRLDPQGKPSLIKKPVLWLASSTGKLFFPVIVEARPFRRKRSFRRKGVGRKCGPTGPETRLAVHLFASETAAVRRSHSVNTPECSQMSALRFPGFHGLHAGRGGRHEPYS